MWSSWWDENWQGNPKCSGKTSSDATLSTTNPTWPDLRPNPGRRGGNLALCDWISKLSSATVIPCDRSISNTVLKDLQAVDDNLTKITKRDRNSLLGLRRAERCCLKINLPKSSLSATALHILSRLFGSSWSLVYHYEKCYWIILRHIQT
jgi:hypothetical protein